jgi:thioredoxin-dependent peroxiredoxin
LGATLVGASYDPTATNRAFAEDQELPFSLLSDVDAGVAESYGVRRPPGSRWVGVPERRTFLIDPAGIIRRIYDVTDVHGHPGEVLDDLRRLRGDEGS